MAIVNKVGNLLRHSAVKHINQEFSVSTPSIFQAIRSMSSAKLFVGGVSYSTDDMSLKEAFARYGEIVDAKVIMDRETGRSRGFGFVVFATSEDASSAIQGMDGQDLHGRRIRVNYATERSRPGFGGSGGGYASSYGGNDNYRAGSYGSGGYGGNDNHRAGSYGSSGYGVMGSYGGGNAGTSYTSGGGGGGGGNSGVYGDSGSRNHGVRDGAVANNYQFNENTGGDLGSVSNELSSNSGLVYDDGQFGSIQNDRIGTENGQSVDTFEDNHRENNDEPDDYAQTRR